MEVSNGWVARYDARKIDVRHEREAAKSAHSSKLGAQLLQ